MVLALFNYRRCTSGSDEFHTTVSSAITRVWLKRIGYIEIDEQANAVCITRTYARACWLLRDFSEQCEDRSSDERPNLFLILSCFIT